MASIFPTAIWDKNVQNTTFDKPGDADRANGADYNEVADETEALQLWTQKKKAVIAKNATGGTLAAKKLVRISGDAGSGTVQISLADPTDPSPALGFLPSAIDDTKEGEVTTLGLLEGVNTGGQTFGDQVFEDTAGAFTFTPNERPIAFIVKVDASTGSIWVTTRSDGGAVALHATTHVTGGADKIRDATAAQDGLMTAAFATKLIGISPGAEVNPVPVSQAEAEAGTGTATRIWTPERVRQAIDALQHVREKSRATFVNVATVQFVLGNPAPGSAYRVKIINMVPAVNDGDVRGRVSIDGGSTFRSTAGDYRFHYSGNNSNSSNGQVYFELISRIGNGSNEDVSIELIIYNPGSTTKQLHLFTHAVGTGVSSNIRRADGGAQYVGTLDDVTDVEIFFDNGNASGEVIVMEEK